MITLRCLKKCLAIFALTGSSLGVLMLETKISRAEYVPPKEQEAPSNYTRSATAGHRGSRHSPTDSPLTLLAPQTHIGQTTLTHPTFAWFVNEPENILQLEFRLFEYDESGKPSQLVKTLIPSRQSSKIQTITLSENESGLKVGRKYLWQVTVYRRDSSIVSQTRADLKVVKTPDSLESFPNATSSVNTYASASLWYDALQQAMAAKTTEVAQIANLLEQLAHIEAASLEEKGLVLSDRLQLIVDTELSAKASFQ